MSRSLPEWRGRTDDTRVPDRVRLRVFEKYEHRCGLCGRELNAGDKWTCDHMRALINGGINAEHNLMPICDWCDVNIKTPADVKLKAKTYARKSKHHGIRKRSQFACNRQSPFKKKIGGKVVRR